MIGIRKKNKIPVRAEGMGVGKSLSAVLFIKAGKTEINTAPKMKADINLSNNHLGLEKSRNDGDAFNFS